MAPRTLDRIPKTPLPTVQNAVEFHWSEIHSRADALRKLGPFRALDEPFVLASKGTVLRMPLVIPAPPGIWDTPSWGEETVRERAARLARAARSAAEEDDLERYLDALPERLGVQWVVLLQAGATALAVFENGEPVATKSFKRYVVRGSGRAQPTHLNAKGKSRYGARLRLQNARRQLSETKERLARLRTEHGEPQQLFWGAPKRLWADFAALCAESSFGAAELIRIPLDLGVPTTAVLLDAYAQIARVRVERPAS